MQEEAEVEDKVDEEKEDQQEEGERQPLLDAQE